MRIISVANIAIAVKALELEKLITQAVIEEIDKKRRLINYCGDKYTHR